jgi:hypothetical protein
MLPYKIRCLTCKQFFQPNHALQVNCAAHRKMSHMSEIENDVVKQIRADVEKELMVVTDD